MELASACSLLTVVFDKNINCFRLSIQPSSPAVIENWEPSTRTSPIWPVMGFEQGPQLGAAEKEHVIFLGPINPALVIESGQVLGCRAWVSLGVYNVVLAHEDEGQVRSIADWASAKGVPWERWELHRGLVKNSQFSVNRERVAEWRGKVAQLVGSNSVSQLHPFIQEYAALLSSAISRAEQHAPHVARDLIELHDSVATLLQRVNQPEQITQAQGLLANLNAGLSRFSSQAFSGTTPILGTECHFWTHSLLGTGVANIALRNLTNFILVRLGEARLSERFRAFGRTNDDILALEYLDHAHAVFSKDHLGGIDLEELGNLKPLISPITYFSGRDGFKNKDLTLSAPLTAISACNSLRWSLLTLTHEASHRFIESLLYGLLPLDRGAEIEKAVSCLDKDAPANWREVLQRYLIKGMAAMSWANQGASGTAQIKVQCENLAQKIDAWRPEIEEIMVHVFDFLYFYQSDTEKYIRSIWVSWSVIPNIANKVPEYIMRSLCAVLSKYIDKENASTLAKEAVVKELEGIRKADVHNHYPAQAIQFINENWHEIEPRLAARHPLVRIVSGFFYSDRICADLWRDQSAGGQAEGPDGYRAKRGHLTPETFDSPLRFLEAFTTTEAPDERRSVWILQNLAFNVSGRVWGG